MNIGTYVCGSCAVGDMQGIGAHQNAEEVMAIFCKSQLGARDASRYGRVAYMILTSFYIFCAGPEVKSTEPGGSHHSKDHWPRYGSELADYIAMNGLGVVVTAGAKENVKHHPGKTAQLWIFSPDQKACEQWWDDYQDRTSTKSLPLVESEMRLRR